MMKPVVLHGILSQTTTTAYMNKHHKSFFPCLASESLYPRKPRKKLCKFNERNTSARIIESSQSSQPHARPQGTYHVPLPFLPLPHSSSLTIKPLLTWLFSRESFTSHERRNVICGNRAENLGSNCSRCFFILNQICLQIRSIVSSDY